MDKPNTMGAEIDAAVLEELSEALEGGELVLFVGGGISAAAGLPTWRQLVELIIERVREHVGHALVVDEVAEFARTHRYIEALAAAEHALGADEFAAFVENALDDEGLDPPKIAIALAALRDKLRAVLTTNLNHLLERAFGFEWESIPRVTDDVAWRRRFILKLHGTLRERDTWLFTRENFSQTVTAPLVRRSLTALFSRCPVLFVGFGRADGNFDEMLKDVHALSGSSPPPRFALVPSASLLPYRRKMLVDMGFRLLPYDTEDGTHDRALALLEQLQRGTRPRVRAGLRSLAPPPIPDLELPTASLLDFAPFELGPDPSGDSGPVSVTAVVNPPRMEAVSEPPASPIEVFFSYSDRNRELRDKLEKHLAILKRKGVIRGWHDGEVGAGEERDKVLIEHLENAKIILLLVSADFLASDFCYDVEMQKAIERHNDGEARVIPVILDACDWEGAPFGKLASLPQNGRPVTSWVNQSEAFTDIARGIRREVERLTPNPS